MKQNTSGFTIVEIVVVCVVLAILTGIGIVSYTTIRNDADQKQVEGLVNIVRGGLERHYSSKGDYPDPATSIGTPADGTTLSSYNTAATTLNATADSLGAGSGRFKLVTCTVTALACKNFNKTTSKDKLYYITRASGDVAEQTITFEDCTVKLSGLNAADSGASSYVLAFVKPDGSAWTRYRSSQGSSIISGTNCEFNA